MAIQASEIMERVQRIAQDSTSVRWPLVELRSWINDAMREIVLQKPTASAATVIATLIAGTYQTVPSGNIAILRIIRNLKSSANPRVGARAVRMVHRNILDSQHPDWHDDTIYPAAAIVKHAIFDPADPLAFHVFPANTGTGYLEITVSKTPTLVPLPADEEDYEDIAAYAVNLDLPDVYFNCILDYVLYRAYSKDAQYTGNNQRAASHYQMFANSLGMKVNIEAIANPNMSTRVEETPMTAAPLTAS